LETIILDANEFNIKLCSDVLQSGGLVAFPTETVYGLGANALDEKAVAGIYSAKGRQEDNPLIVHIASPGDVKPLVVNIPDAFEPLVRIYWPGPLTLVMLKSDIVPDNVTAGLDTVAVRMPEHPVAQSLIQAFGCPVAAPSANPSGKPSPTKAKHVFNDLKGKIPYVLDGGDCRVGLESTVLDITSEIPIILRPGCVTYEQLKGILGVVDIAGTEDVKVPASPGMKYRHYAPRAPLIAVVGSPDKTAEYIAKHIDADMAALMFDDFIFSHPNVVTFGSSKDYATQASRLFNALRKIDDLTSTSIFAQVPPEEGLGSAVANRLKKAAGNNIVDLSD